MQSKNLDNDLKVALSIPQFAEELFALTDKNRSYLSQWLPWLEGVQTIDDTSAFIEQQLQYYAQGLALNETVFFKGRIAGVLGFVGIDRPNGIGQIGYWLGQEFTGKGIMTRAVADLICFGFSQWKLQKVEIRCAVQNEKSRAIPERLGFVREGTLRRAEKVNDCWHDLVVYGLLREDFLKCKT